MSAAEEAVSKLESEVTRDTQVAPEKQKEEETTQPRPDTDEEDTDDEEEQRSSSGEGSEKDDTVCPLPSASALCPPSLTRRQWQRHRRLPTRC